MTKMLLGYGQFQFAAYSMYGLLVIVRLDMFNIHKLNKVKKNKDNRTYIILVI